MIIIINMGNMFLLSTSLIIFLASNSYCLFFPSLTTSKPPLVKLVPPGNRFHSSQANELSFRIFKKPIFKYTI